MTGYLDDRPDRNAVISIVIFLDVLRSALVAVVNLAALLTSLLRPWEVGDWDKEEGVARVGHTGECVVPKLC